MEPSAYPCKRRSPREKMVKRPRYSSNAGIFEKRGNPWVSRREGETKFGRNLETEDAEYDFDHRYHQTETVGKPRMAEPRPVYRDPVRTPKVADFATRKANALRKMRNDMNARSHNMVSVSPHSYTFKPCPDCRHASCATKMRCSFPLGEKK